MPARFGTEASSGPNPASGQAGCEAFPLTNSQAPHATRSSTSETTSVVSRTGTVAAGTTTSTTGGSLPAVGTASPVGCRGCGAIAKWRIVTN